MRMSVSAIALILLLPLAASGQQKGKSVYTYEDEDGVTVITDRPPPESSEFPKSIVNEHGVTVGEIAGKKTAEEIAAEEREKKLTVQRELQNRADQALLATYVNIDEIIMHRDRRVELFQAQAVREMRQLTASARPVPQGNDEILVVAPPKNRRKK